MYTKYFTVEIAWNNRTTTMAVTFDLYCALLRSNQTIIVGLSYDQTFDSYFGDMEDIKQYNTCYVILVAGDCASPA